MAAPEDTSRHRLLGVMPREIETQVRREPDDTVSTWPHFLVRHAVVAGVTVVAVFALAIAFDAPLQEIANRNLTPPVAKAPWYFAGLQELLAHFHPMVAGVLIPAAAVVFMLVVPYVDRGTGTRVRARKVMTLVFTVVITAAVALTVIGALFRGPGWQWVWPWRELYLEL
jgi:quinol-cytochrome oxidoreductase complex cytochrome b subunit